MRIGFACHYVLPASMFDRKHPSARPFVMKATTKTYVMGLDSDVAAEYLHGIVEHNLNAVQAIMEAVAGMDEQLRMLRLSSDLFPLFTVEDLPTNYYRSNTFRKLVEPRLKLFGDFARQHGIRLSFHPAQFVVLGSPMEQVVTSSIKELEYHAYMARCMGYAREHGDMKCTIHLAGKTSVNNFLKNYYKLSPEARKIVVVENTEFGIGTLNNCLKLIKHIPIVLDVHHHWIQSKGEYIQPKDERVWLVRDSWAKTFLRPVMHFSWIKEGLTSNLPKDVLPSYKQLRSKYNDNQLRSHGMMFDNTAVMDWALSFNRHLDIMVEAKAKNMASYGLFQYKVSQGEKYD